MRLVFRSITVFLLLFILSCAKGGPLTPADTFMVIRSAADKNDRDVIFRNLSSESIKKINEFVSLTAKLNDTQIKAIAMSENIPAEKLKSMKPAECTTLYFSRNRYGHSLSDIFNEDIVAVDVNGDTAVVKTSGGFELDFVREGPYWKFDLSRL